MKMEQLGACVEAKKRQLHDTDVQSSLKQELQAQLQNQLFVRHALEKALSNKPFSHNETMENSIPKAAMELIKEIGVLELEVFYLEQHLLSLYRKTFDLQTSYSTMEKIPKPGPINLKGITAEFSQHSIIPGKDDQKDCNGICEPQNLTDSSIYRTSSSLSQHSSCSVRNSPLSKYPAKALDSYHSLPLSLLEQSSTDTSNEANLEEDLVTCIPDHLHWEGLGMCIPDHPQETPNSLSEEIIKCISAIYIELADPPLIHHNYSSAPLISFSSSVYESSSKDIGHKWNRQWWKLSNSPFENRFCIRGSQELGGPYCKMLKVQWISRDSQKLKDVTQMQHKFRSLVYQLEEVDPRMTNHEEKLAFWINIHNALVMHAYLVYGIPKNNLKRMSLLLKAAYNVGGQIITIDTIQSSILWCRLPHPGQIITIDTIQSSILRCRLPRPGQWLRLLFSINTKLKASDTHKAFAIDRPEPLLYFALCSGCRSDPVVRPFTPKKVHAELNMAKEEYIQSTFRIQEQKIHLPKNVESFTKASGSNPADLFKMVEHQIPDWGVNKVEQFQHKKKGKSIE